MPVSKPHAEAPIRNAPVVQLLKSQAGISQAVGPQSVISSDVGLAWPPNTVDVTCINRVVFIAGDVGVSPLISILSHINETNVELEEIHFLYTTGVKGYYNTSHILGLERLLSVCKTYKEIFHLYLFFSGYASRALMEAAVPRQRFEPRVIMGADVLDVFEKFESKHTTVCYVAGPPDITDQFVRLLEKKVGMGADRVFFKENESGVSQALTDI